jgi:nucleoside-diphosphate-sugar epimerase
MINMSRILITGGAGFIGSHLEPELIKRGHDVYIMDRLRLTRPKYYRGDIFDYIRMREIFDAVNPEVVYHFAGMISRKECEETQQMAIMINQVGTLNICNLSAIYDARVIYAGSSEEYGTAFDTGELITEKSLLGIPTSIYSLTKRAAGDLVSYYERFKGLDAIILRFFMLYGPGERPTEYRSAIARFVHYALHNKPLPVHKNTERAWCYIEDAVDAIATMADKSKIKSGEILNIGSGDNISTEDLAKIIVMMCDSKSRINLIDVEPTIIPSKRASFERVKNLIGWEATTPVEFGLSKVIDSQKKYQP